MKVTREVATLVCLAALLANSHETASSLGRPQRLVEKANDHAEALLDYLDTVSQDDFKDDEVSRQRLAPEAPAPKAGKPSPATPKT